MLAGFIKILSSVDECLRFVSGSFEYFNPLLAAKSAVWCSKCFDYREWVSLIENGVVDCVPNEPWGQYFEVLEECSKVSGKGCCTDSRSVACHGLFVVLLHSCFEMLMSAPNVHIPCEYALGLVHYYTASTDVIMWAFVIGGGCLLVCSCSLGSGSPEMQCPLLSSC